MLYTTFCKNEAKRTVFNRNFERPKGNKQLFNQNCERANGNEQFLYQNCKRSKRNEQFLNLKFLQGEAKGIFLIEEQRKIEAKQTKFSPVFAGANGKRT